MEVQMSLKIIISYVILVLLYWLIRKRLYGCFKHISQSLIRNRGQLAIDNLSSFLPYSATGRLTEGSDEIAYLISRKGLYSSYLKLEGYPYESFFEQQDEEGKRVVHALPDHMEKLVRFFSRIETKNNNTLNNIDINWRFFKEKEGSSYQYQYYVEVRAKELTDLTASILNLKEVLEDLGAKLVNQPAMLELQYYLINKTRPLGTIEPANFMDLACSSELAILDQGNYGVIRNASRGELYFSFVSLVLTNKASSLIIKELMSLNGEIEVFYNLAVLSSESARKVLSQEKTKVTLAENNLDRVESLKPSERFGNELLIAEEAIANLSDGLLIGDLTLSCFANSVVELDQLKAKANKILRKYEVEPKEEGILTKFFYLARLAGFEIDSHEASKKNPWNKSLAYYKKYMATTITALVDVPRPPRGFTSNDWGQEAITSFPTSLNNDYQFNLHLSEHKGALAHSVILGTSGGGKTTFFQYIAGEALDKYEDLSVFCFDSFEGMSIFTDSRGGENIDFGAIALNPFKTIDNEEDERFILALLKIMAGLTPEDNYDEALKHILATLKSTPERRRILSDLYEIEVLFTDTAEGKDLKKRLYKWCKGSYKNYLNHQEDNFTLSNRLTTFQMDKIIEDLELSIPIIFYIIYKIRKYCSSGKPHMVFLDECAKLIKNKVFAEQIKIMLAEHRKLRGSINLAFQTPNTFLKSEIKSEILTNIANVLILGQNEIKEEAVNELGVSVTHFAEHQRITRESKHGRWMLVSKRGVENVIINYDLRERLGEKIKLLSSEKQDVIRQKRLKKEYVNNWIEPYLAGEVNNNMVAVNSP